MKLQSVLVVSMLVGGAALVSSPARADGICISLDGSCSSTHNPACTTSAQCAVSGLVSGLTTCDTVAGHCVAKCGQGVISGVLTTLSCGGDKPVCYAGNSALSGLCGCTADTDCSGGKTCNTTLHQCVTPVTVPPIVVPPVVIPPITVPPIVLPPSSFPPSSFLPSAFLPSSFLPSCFRMAA